MITVATMETNNPVLILAAMAWNAAYALTASAASLLQAIGVTLLAFFVAHGRLIVTVAGLVAAVVVVALFWQAILLTGGVFAGMYAGLKLVMWHQG